MDNHEQPSNSSEDMWHKWLRSRRFSGGERETKAKQRLRRNRETVLDNADLEEGDTVLDIGAGGGLIAFGAVDRVGEPGRVILSDISRDLLETSQAIAADLGVEDRCDFLVAPAQDLSAIDDGAVDAITLRSVLIYVEEKEEAFQEFYRVLKPGGRLSMYEPINSFFPVMEARSNTFWQYDMDRVDLDVTPVPELARKVREYQAESQTTAGEEASMGFTERDMWTFAESAGFEEIFFELSAWKTFEETTQEWEAFLNTAWSPEVPTIEEAMEAVLTAEERELLTNNLRPLVESDAPKDDRGVESFLWAVKN